MLPRLVDQVTPEPAPLPVPFTVAVHVEVPPVLTDDGLQLTVTDVTVFVTPALVTVKVTVRVWLLVIPVGYEKPPNCIFPICCPTLNPAGFAETVTVSELLAVIPELSEAGETDSQLGSPGATLTLVFHVSFDPGAPVLVIVIGWVTALPADAAVGVHVFWLKVMAAIGSQRMI